MEGDRKGREAASQVTKHINIESGLEPSSQGVFSVYFKASLAKWSFSAGWSLSHKLVVSLALEARVRFIYAAPSLCFSLSLSAPWD